MLAKLHSLRQLHIRKASMTELRPELHQARTELARRSGALARKKLRVLACSGSLDGGGSERQLWQLVNHLDRARFEPQLYLLYRRGVYLDRIKNDIVVHAFQDAFPDPRSAVPGSISRWQARHMRQVVRSQNIDIVYDRTFHLALLSATSCKSSPPRVSVIVSPPSRDLPGTEQKWLWFKRWLLSHAFRTAAATICVSEEVADDASAYYRLRRERLLVIPNPIDFEGVVSQSQEQLAVGAETFHGGGPRQKLHVAVVGRFTVEKGHRFAVAVAGELARRAGTMNETGRSLPIIEFHFVGGGPLESQLKELVKTTKIEHLVHFHGFMVNPYPMLRKCDLVFVPSEYEGFPNVALEAFALGVPLLMADYGATARHIVGPNGARGQLVRLGDNAAAADAIIDRWENSAMWNERAAVARDWVRAEHAFDKWLETMSDLLERIVFVSSKR